jgi:hypothetical protein
MLQRASSSPLTHTLVALRPHLVWGSLYQISILSGSSEGHLNMRDDQSQVGPLGSRTTPLVITRAQPLALLGGAEGGKYFNQGRTQEHQPRRGLPWPEQTAKGAGSRVWRGGPRQSRDERRFVYVLPCMRCGYHPIITPYPRVTCLFIDSQK